MTAHLATSASDGSPAAATAIPDEAFAERLVGMLNDGALCLMISIGHRAGLFDAMADLPPADSATIAAAAGLEERYVREWMGAMTVGRVVDHDPEAGTYALPAGKAAFLARDGGAETLGLFAQHIAALGSVEDDILACFRHGGGVPYARYTRFHEIMAEDSGQTVLPVLVDTILPLADGLVDRLAAGIRVLDAGCGRGLALMRMAETWPASRFTGYDLSAEAIGWATAEAARRGLANIRFEVRDLSDFDRTAEPGAFDFVTTFDAIHDQARPDALLAGIRRSLAPGGVYLAQDIKGSSHVHENLDHPLGPLLYTVSCLHCMTVSLAQGGQGLGAMWGRQAAERHLAEAGFADVVVHELEHDIQNYYYVCRV
ncbi:MAG: class I SAM-dependent methyltransferase [Azospirillaceae bacterium]